MSLRATAALVTISSPNFAAIVHFYTYLLEQQPDPFQLNRYAEFQLPGLRLGIFRPKDNQESARAVASPLSPKPLLGISLCLEVEHLEAAIDHLSELGYPPPGAILTATHGREIYAYDPDGNCLILHQGSS